MEREKEIEMDLQPVCILYKDGTLERFDDSEDVPAGDDTESGVSTRDVVISEEETPEVVSARLFLPLIRSGKKFPLVVYLHGGIYVGGSPTSSPYHHYQSALAKSRVMVVGVKFRVPPAVPFSTSAEDAWAALKWVASSSSSSDPWMAKYADMEKMTVMGDCTGCVLANAVVRRASKESLPNGVKINGLVLVHPSFWGNKPIQGEEFHSALFEFTAGLWKLAEPNSSGCDDPLLNPVGPLAPPLTDLACKRVLVCSAEKDWLKFRAANYYKKLGTDGWTGTAEYWETDTEDHLFHLYDPGNEDAKILLKRIGHFINGVPAPPITRRVTALF